MLDISYHAPYLVEAGFGSKIISANFTTLN
jgi:hypothetical protein